MDMREKAYRDGWQAGFESGHKQGFVAGYAHGHKAGLEGRNVPENCVPTPAEVAAVEEKEGN